MKFPIYMDNHATTPVDPRVLEVMLPFLKDKFGNVGSGHLCGREMRNPVYLARKQVADLIGANEKEVVFTSGATESDNLAIKGVAFARQNEGKHIITCKTEHKAVLDTCEFLAGKGFEITCLDVDKFGQVTADQVEAAIQTTGNKTVLVSIMGANNEIGTCHPTAEIGKMCRRRGIVFHVDAAQTAGKIPFDVSALNVDLASMSGHKIYGPKGIGALYIRKEVQSMIEPQMHGGGQEWGMRSGTLPVHMVVAFGKACEIASQEMVEENEKMIAMRHKLEKGIRETVGGVRLNGHPTNRLPGNLHLTFEGVDGELLMLGLKTICCSASSACSSSMMKPSHVLLAIGLSEKEAMASIRFGLGRFNQPDEIDYAIETVKNIVDSLRSPP